jgi:hypothetical protein
MRLPLTVALGLLLANQSITPSVAAKSGDDLQPMRVLKSHGLESPPGSTSSWVLTGEAAALRAYGHARNLRGPVPGARQRYAG